MDAETCGRIVETFARDSPDDEGSDILSKLSASSLHQMMHIHEAGTHRFVAAVGGDGTPMRTAM